MLEIGEIGKFIVKRETDISYTLSPDDDELTNYIFLHFNQAPRRLEMGEKINAFLYFDNKRRLCATMETPLITTKKYGFVEVVNTCSSGVFVNIGIAKDILLSSDFLPKHQEAWPKVNDVIPCILKVKRDQLVARIITPQDVSKKASKKIGDSIDATVCRLTSDGIGLFSDDFEYIFVHRSMTRKKYRLGEKDTLKIIHINDEGCLIGSFIKQKEFSRLDDSDRILEYLNNFGGVLQLGNASSPDEIKKYFNMSKSAFKRAVGDLYKKRLITIEDNKITLIKK